MTQPEMPLKAWAAPSLFFLTWTTRCCRATAMCCGVDFLIDEGVLDRAAVSPRNADMEARYKVGTVGLEEFANFFVGTLAGRTPKEWEPLRQAFLARGSCPAFRADALAW
jgi:hypothetical protein